MKNSSDLVNGLQRKLETRKQDSSYPSVNRSFASERVQNYSSPNTASTNTVSPYSSASGRVAETSFDDASFGSELNEVLKPYTINQKHKIMAFFGIMVENFSTQFTYLYGSQPDNEFAEFAADLDINEVERIVQHLRERLLEKKEWPPALGMLKLLKDLPLNKEVLEARHNILILRKPQSRVEEYIMKRKASKIRSLSEKHLADEFRVLYISAYEEVQKGYDLVLDDQQAKNQAVLDSIKPTKMDQEVDRRVKEGIVPGGRVGSILSRINKLRDNQAAD